MEALVPSEILDLTSQAVHLKHVAPPAYYVKPPNDLLESIREFGILEPLILRVVSTPDTDYIYQVVAGRRRFFSAGEAGLEIIPARVLGRNQTYSLEAISLIENAHRRPNDAVAFESLSLLLKQGHTLEDIRDTLHLDGGTLTKLMRLTKLRPDLQRAVVAGNLNVTTAYSITKLPEDKQIVLGAKLIIDGKVTAADVKEMRLAQREEAQSELGDLAEIGGELTLDWRVYAQGRLSEVYDTLMRSKDSDAMQMAEDIEGVWGEPLVMDRENITDNGDGDVEFD